MLPIHDKKDEILTAVRDHQVVIVAGETGSGKSTQLPQMLLELGRAADGAMIGHTQPRRLAARTIAERVAEELGTSVGGTVGYAVRFTDRVGPSTRVKVMTDGILLAETQRDRQLRRYDTLIVDEAHERSLNIDFILGYLKQLLPRRPDLKVVVTSATIDTERFSRHFDDAPVVEVSGRTYPVEVRYQPIVDDASDSGRDQAQAICEAVAELGREGPGDVLVFLSGEREIRDTADALTALRLDATEIMPLYARLSAAEQHRVFQAHPGRRVVLATNVAETSLTVPGIRYVVDAGTARISRYNRRTKVQRLPIEAVSQASADQRAGRCGRVAPGICIRLYSEDDYLGRPEYTEPEILRTNLASVILQMAAIGLGDIASFPFIEAPDARNIKDGVALLEELGALDPDRAGTRGWLTRTGRQLAQLPLDPRLGRMVLEAVRHGCVREVMVIAAALSIQDPRERPQEQQQAAAEHHNRFADPDSDFVTLLSLWDYLRTEQRRLSSNQFRKLCRAEFLNYLRVREWQDIYSQLRQAMSGIGVHVSQEPGDRDRIHRALLAGLLSQIGSWDAARREYLGARGARFAIAPGSALHRANPRWVMAGELVETNRMWARVVARIRPEWAEQAGSHLVKRSYTDPEWSRGRATAMTTERVTLYGLPLVAARPVPYSRINARAARELFIWHALVEGDWKTHHAFVAANAALVDEIRALEDKARRRDILVDDETLFDFFAERVGDEVVSGRHFDRWWNQRRGEQPDRLTFTRELLVDPEAAGVDPFDFPDTWTQSGVELALSYRFDPGAPDDGVTVHIPLVLLNQVSEAGFDWHVPGHREALVTELIRSLPKALRRHFVPAPDFARAVLSQSGPADGPLLEVLSRQLGLLTGERVPSDSWQPDHLPDHLRLTFAVEDEHGASLGRSKELADVKARLGRAHRAAMVEAAAHQERPGLTAWPGGAIPRVVEGTRGGYPVKAYPALIDEGRTVALRMTASPEEQEAGMWSGTRRLLLLALPSPGRALERSLTADARLALVYAPHASVADLYDDCITAAVDELMTRHGGPAWDEAGYTRLLAEVRDDLVDEVVAVGRKVASILVTAGEIRRRLDGLAPALAAVGGDVERQLAGLVYPGFVSGAGAPRLDDITRYLAAVVRRLEKAVADPRRDAQGMARVQPVERAYDDLLDTFPAGPVPHAVAEIAWLIEELRVSVFAQQLGTRGSVSEKRIRREIEQCARATAAS